MHAVAKLANGYKQKSTLLQQAFPPWLIFSATSSHFSECLVYYMYLVLCISFGHRKTSATLIYIGTCVTNKIFIVSYINLM